MNHEADFFTQLIKQKTPIAVFLRNGIKILGILTEFEDEVIFLNANTKIMIYKSAINSILPVAGMSETTSTEEKKKTKRSNAV